MTADAKASWAGASAVLGAGPWLDGSVRSLQVPVLTASDWVLAVFAIAALTLAIVLAVSLGRSNRRAISSSMRELTQAAREMAAGRSESVPTLPPEDPLSPLATAVGHLTTALQARAHELESNLRGLEEILLSADKTVILLADHDATIRYASPGAEKLFGWRSGEGRGRPLSSLFEEGAFQALLPKLSRKTLKDIPVLDRFRLALGDGANFPAEVKVSAFRSLPGGGEGYVLDLRDLREEEALRKEIVESEEKHRALAEQIPLGVLVVQDGKIVFANSALAEMLQVSDGLVGSDFREYLASEDLLQVLDRVRRAETGEEPSFELDCRLRSASSRWPTEVTLRAARVLYGGRTAVIGTVRDAGPDRGALRQVRVSAAKLDAALGASDEAVVLLSSAASGGTVTLANRRFEELFGLEARGLVGLTLEELAERLSHSFVDPDAVRAHLLKAMSPVFPLPSAAFDATAPPGRSIDLSSRPAYDREGRLIGRVVSARDITLQREQERRLAREAEELARTRDLLERANRDLEVVNREISATSADVERANQELRTLDEMKSNLLANVSHELQTPLVSIKGYTEMILKGRLGAVTEEQRKGLEVSLRNIDRLIGMINNLLNFSRIERDMAGMIISSFPLPDLVEEAIELVRAEAASRRISVTTRYMTDELMVRADRDKIAQVFINLLGNGVKYNRDGGQVQVDVRRGKRGYLIVDIRDTGIGIPKESIEKIFDRFYRVAGEPPTGTTGSGIGLSIVRDILRMHGCIIKAESTLGEGTVFTFTLPLAGAADHGGPSVAGGSEKEHSPRGPLPTSI